MPCECFSPVVCRWKAGERKGQSPALVDPPVSDALGAALSPQQEALLLQLRERLGPEGQEVEAYKLLRFLRARKWQLQATVDQYDATRRFRAENNVDGYRKSAAGPDGLEAALQVRRHPQLAIDGVEVFPQLRLTGLHCDEAKWFYLGCTAFFGTDKQGRPIWLQQMGLASQRFPEMYAYAGRQGILSRYLMGQELQQARMEESSAILGQRVTTQIVIMDVKGVAVRPDPRALAVFKDMVLISAQHYPETLEMQFFINVPRVFMAVWSVVRTWLDPVTSSKMVLLGSDYQETLLRYIDADQLPVAYGGTNKIKAFAEVRSPEEAGRYLGDFQLAADALAHRRSTDKIAPSSTPAEAPDTFKSGILGRMFSIQVVSIAAAAFLLICPILFPPTVLSTC